MVSDMSFDFERLNERYNRDPSFNAAVRVLRALIEQHGFVPCEIREALFFAQYTYEMSHAEKTFINDLEWSRLRDAKEIIKNNFSLATSKIIEEIQALK